MSNTRMGYVHFRRKLLWGYLVLCTLLLALLSWKMAAGYISDRDEAAMLTQNSARAMAAHVEELIDAIDHPLRNSVHAIAALGARRLTPESIAPLLATSTRASDSRYWLLFIDAHGNGVVASSRLAVEGVSYADRAYFRDAAGNRADRLNIGGPSDGRVSKRRLFFLSRRVEAADGTFLGVVVAPVDAWRVASVFEKSRLGPAMSIALATQSNLIVARVPQFEESFGADMSRVGLANAQLRPGRYFEADSPFNGERRLFSFAQVGALPLMVTVGVTRESWMAGFRADLYAGLIGLAVVLTVALFSGKLALEQYKRLEDVEASQRTLIAELGAAKEELARGERRLRMIADHLPARVAYINADERYTYHNCGVYGMPQGASAGKTLLETHGEEIYNLLRDDTRKALAGIDVSTEHCYARDGERRYFQHQYTPDITENGRVVGFYAMVTDITDFKTIQQRLAAIARVDALTGLPNRAELLDRLECALARCRRTDTSLACLYLDIDRFKEVNDTLGHAGGDHALVEFGKRLRQCVRESDVVARLYGDEFVIVLEAFDHPAEAERVAAKIIASMAPPFVIDGTPRRVTTSVGIVVANVHCDNPGALLQAADQALYRAKRAGRNQFAAQA